MQPKNFFDFYPTFAKSCDILRKNVDLKYFSYYKIKQ